MVSQTECYLSLSPSAAMVAGKQTQNLQNEDNAINPRNLHNNRAQVLNTL
jgi:hypothetical protein